MGRRWSFVIAFGPVAACESEHEAAAGNDEAFPAAGCTTTKTSPTEVLVDCGPNLPALRLMGDIEGRKCKVDEISVGLWEVTCGTQTEILEEADAIELIALRGDAAGTMAELSYVRFSQSGAVAEVPLSDVGPGWRIDEVIVDPDRAIVAYQAVDQDPPVVFCCSDCPEVEREDPRLFVAWLHRDDLVASYQEVPLRPQGNRWVDGPRWNFAHGLGAGRGRLQDIWVRRDDGFFTIEVKDGQLGDPVERQSRTIDLVEYENSKGAGAFFGIWDEQVGRFRLQYRPEGKPDGVWISTETVPETKVAECVDCGVYIFDGDRAMMVAESIFSTDIADRKPSRVALVEMSRLPDLSHPLISSPRRLHRRTCFPERVDRTQRAS